MLMLDKEEIEILLYVLDKHIIQQQNLDQNVDNSLFMLKDKLIKEVDKNE